MGTSSARQAPVGKFWRLAKTSASRFASGKVTSSPKVADVVIRYLTALGAPEAGSARDFLPDLVRTAATLGDFYRTWQELGWDAALVHLGLNPAGYQAGEAVIPDLLDRLAGPGAGLEEAVSRAALIDHLVPVLCAAQPPDPSSTSTGLDSPDVMVCQFLGLALNRKMQSDLGEPLEFHALTISRGLARQEALKAHILAKLPGPAANITGDAAFSPERIQTLLDLIMSRLDGRREP